MRNTTICYIERDNKYLMLHRIKKDASVDPSHNKWIGVGGKFEKDESPDECIIRETKEETGLELISPRLRGIATFISDEWETEYMFIFTADNFNGELAEDCKEGNLKWIPKDEVMNLPVWEGDKIFLKLLIDDAPFFLLKLVYEGENLVKYTLS